MKEAPAFSIPHLNKKVLAETMITTGRRERG
jgi:hypothetical protein